MFGGATNKLEDARTVLENLKAALDAPTFRSLFNSFLSAARAITYALQKDGAKVKGFAGWYTHKRDEMKGDELLRFIHDARTEDFHEGRHRLQFGTHIAHFSTEEAGPPPATNAVIVIGAEDPFWIVDQGTPRERRIPIKSGGSFATRVAIAHPPATHLGKELERRDPLTICLLALEFLENLVYEAKSRFRAE